MPRISMNTGTIVTCIGTIIVARTTPKSRPLAAELQPGEDVAGERGGEHLADRDQRR